MEFIKIYKSYKDIFRWSIFQKESELIVKHVKSIKSIKSLYIKPVKVVNLRKEREDMTESNRDMVDKRNQFNIIKLKLQRKLL